MKRNILVSLAVLTLTALHLGFQPPAQAESAVNLELKSMYKKCSKPAECIAIFNVLKRRGVK